MAIQWIKPMRRIKKVKSIDSQEVLQRLQIFLESDQVMEMPVRILARFWEDQQKVLGYPELRQIVQDGTLSQQMLPLWSQDYSVFVANQFSSVWMEAVKAGATAVTEQPLFQGIPFTFQIQTPGLFHWIQQRGAEFVTACTKEQKQAISTLLTNKMKERHTVEELSRMIRPCIGLTKEQAKANVRYYETIVETLKKEHPKMKLESIQRKAQEAAQKYAERQHRQRAMTVAQTESAFAYHRGADEGIRQAQAQNLLGTVKKRWCTSGDDAVCEVCASLDGMEVDMDVNFKIKGKVLFKGQHMLPPAHPRCACAVEYIEVEKSVFVSQSEPEIRSCMTENADCLIRDHIQGQDTLEEREIVNSAINSVPIKVQEQLNKSTIIDVGKNGASQYDYNNDILYVAKGSEREDVIHEIGHMVENKMMDNITVIKLLEDAVRNVTIFDVKSEIYYDAEGNEREIFLIKSDKFVSEYQGRLYTDDIFSEFDMSTGKIKTKRLMEFISEAFRIYCVEPSLLKNTYQELYEYIKEVVE